jgi:glycosyltransferase involved in cell wall biosynthesis
MNLSKVDTYVINLDSRTDKREWISQQMKKRHWPIRFFTAKPHPNNPKRGCLESHLSIIKRAIQQQKKCICILEDDAQVIKKNNYIPTLPNDWCMAYLGGTVCQRFEEYNDEKQWIRMACWTTHAYLINLENKEFVNAILEMESYPKEIDQFYIDKIHSNYPCYMINPMMILQKSGYSDIEKSDVNYDFMQYTLKGLQKPMVDIVDDSYVLKLPDMSYDELPCVSIVTPTFERRKFFPLALYNFRHFDYPSKKLEWIIIDDSVQDERTIEDIIPKDPRIRYLRIEGNKTRLTVGQKRNIGAQYAKYPYIVHMDDDDYYPPESILARIKTLLKYQQKGIECVGCSEYGIYNLIENVSSMASDGPLSLSEASMAYTKQFWEKQKFVENEIQAEYRSFMANRFHKCMDIPYEFVLIAMSHNQNLTGVLRYTNKQLKQNQDKVTWNYLDAMDEDVQELIQHIQMSLMIPEPDYKALDKELGMEEESNEKNDAN